MKLLGFDHIALCAKDPKATAEWYIKYLGFKLEFVNDMGVYYISAGDSVMLEIMAPQKGLDPDGAPNAIGFKHIAIVPEDFDSAVAELQAAGIGAQSKPSKRDDGYCAFFFKDPDGNVVHFAKWANDRRMFQK